MANEKEGWVVLPLVDRSVSELVIPRRNVKHLREVSRNYVETSGLLYGNIFGGSVYFVGSTCLGEGSRTSCSFDPKFRNFNNFYTRRLKEAFPNMVTIQYHNHPTITPDECGQEFIESLRRDVDSGIFDYLLDHGVTPTIHEAIREGSRTLSPQDIRATFGNVHVLMTDTDREGEEFSHINAYAVNPRVWGGERRFRVTPLSHKLPALSSLVGGWCNKAYQIHERCKREFLERKARRLGFE
ncbi:MAG: hypothetical protein NUV97_00750 [archaeon]|nr:hypothetical protein [archaeon]MCR4323358.1 hypothetical protein [Nanoarchaeota archaeon]